MEEERPAAAIGARRPRQAAPAARLIRAAAFLAILAGAFFVAHAAAIHELLGRRRLVDLACKHPERFLFGWERAESRWPGRVRLKNAWFRGRGRRDEWHFTLAEAELRISPLALLSSTFHVRELDARGLTFRFQRRREPSEAQAGLARSLPPIPGFADVPVRGNPPGTPPRPGKKYWRVALDSIRIERVAEIWIDTFRYEGNAAVRGGFFLHPHHRARVRPTEIRIGEGRVTRGGLPVARAVAGTLQAEIGEFDIPAVRAKRATVWEETSGRLRLSASGGHLARLDPLLPKGVAARSDDASLDLSLRMTEGDAAGRLALRARRVRLSLPRARATGSLSVDATVDRFAFATRELSLSRARLAVANVSLAGPEPLTGWWGRLDASPLLFTPKNGLRAPLALESRDARPFFAALAPGTPKVVRGLVSMEGLAARARLALGKGRLSLDGVRASGEGAQVTGGYRRRGEEKRGAFLVEKGKLAVGIGVEGGRSRFKVLGARSWFERESRSEELPRAGKTR